MIKVGSDEGEGLELKESDDGRSLFLSGTWKGRTSKSKKGNWNMAWFKKDMFDKLIEVYQNGGSTDDKGEEEVF
jgi:hypothetical protein